MAEGNSARWFYSNKDIISDAPKVDKKKTGESSTSCLKRLRLKVGAIPSIFSNCLKYLPKSCSKIRESDENNLLMAINEIKASFIAYRESISFQSFDRLLEIIDSFAPEQNWLKIRDLRQLDAVNLSRKKWSPQPGRMRQLDACVNWTRRKLDSWE
jgi:hypothetical protein